MNYRCCFVEVKKKKATPELSKNMKVKRQFSSDPNYKLSEIKSFFLLPALFSLMPGSFVKPIFGTSNID
jgi:hypothetical protein